MKKKQWTSRCRVYREQREVHNCSIYQQMSVFVTSSLLQNFPDFNHKDESKKRFPGLLDRHGTESIPPERQRKYTEKIQHFKILRYKSQIQRR